MILSQCLTVSFYSHISDIQIQKHNKSQQIQIHVKLRQKRSIHGNVEDEGEDEGVESSDGDGP